MGASSREQGAPFSWSESNPKRGSLLQQNCNMAGLSQSYGLVSKHLKYLGLIRSHDLPLENRPISAA
jgi:hypothetical protein